MDGAKLIETVYREARRRGGQQAQLDFKMATNELTAAFVATAEDVQGLKARGTFFPEGTRTSLFTLSQARAGSIAIADTEHVQALLGRRHDGKSPTTALWISSTSHASSRPCRRLLPESGCG